MATTSKPYTFSAGATIKASEHNNNFDTLFVDFNGNITNANFSGNAAIADTKLAQITTSSKVDFSALSTTNQATGDILFYSGTNLWVRLARGTANQSLKCQHDSQTVLLLSCDGTDGSTVFTDSSLSVKTISVVGNAQIDTAQSKFGGASGLFDGTGDCLTTPDHNDWNFGSGNFTVDTWVRIAGISASTQAAFAAHYDISGDQRSWIVGLNDTAGTRKLLFTLSTDGPAVTTTEYMSNAITFDVGNWYHIAVVRDGNTVRFFLDGVAIGTGDLTGKTLFNSTALLTIGAISAAAPTLVLNGWLDELRVSNGIARWTANFTPETTAYLPVPIWIT